MEILFVTIACLLALGLALSVRNASLRAREARLEAGRAGERSVGEVIDMAGGHDRLDDVVLGGSRGRAAQVDQLVRGRSRLVVVEVKNWSGEISGAADDPKWTLVRASGSRTTFRNPLLQARRQAGIVAEACGEDPPEVASLVVMAGRARHAAGAFPEGVVATRDLRRVLPRLLGTAGEPDPRIEPAWAALVEQAFAPDAAARASRYVGRLEERFGEKPWRSWIVVAFALAAVAWTMGLCIEALRLEALYPG